MKHTFLKDDEISMMLGDYYDGKKTIKDCMAKYKVGKSTVMKYLREKGSGGRKRDEYNNNTYQCDESFFEKMDSHEKAYWFGFITADGNIYNNKLQISLNLKDEGHLIKFCQRICYNGILYNDNTCKKLMICRKKIVSDLKNLGLKPNKTLLIDDTIFDQIPNNFLKSAILGYIDGDGCFHNNPKGKNTKFSVVGNESFLIFLQNFFKLYGLKLSEPKKDKRTKQTFYSNLSLSGNKLDIMIDCLYGEGSQDFLERKRNKLNYERQSTSL